MSNSKDIQNDLIEKLDDLTARLSAIEKDINHQESPINADLEEQATEIENDEVLEALENETITTIDDIKNALKRMEEGSYGSCAVCGIEISEERIKALPYTDKCFECSSK